MKAMRRRIANALRVVANRVDGGETTTATRNSDGTQTIAFHGVPLAVVEIASGETR